MRNKIRVFLSIFLLSSLSCVVLSTSFVFRVNFGKKIDASNMFPIENTQNVDVLIDFTNDKCLRRDAADDDEPLTTTNVVVQQKFVWKQVRTGRLEFKRHAFTSDRLSVDNIAKCRPTVTITDDAEQQNAEHNREQHKPVASHIFRFDTENARVVQKSALHKTSAFLRRRSTPAVYVRLALKPKALRWQTTQASAQQQPMPSALKRMMDQQNFDAFRTKPVVLAMPKKISAKIANRRLDELLGASKRGDGKRLLEKELALLDAFIGEQLYNERVHIVVQGPVSAKSATYLQRTGSDGSSGASSSPRREDEAAAAAPPQCQDVRACGYFIAAMDVNQVKGRCPDVRLDNLNDESKEVLKAIALVRLKDGDVYTTANYGKNGNEFKAHIDEYYVLAFGKPMFCPKREHARSPNRVKPIA